MHATRAAALLTLASLCASCAATWAPRIARSEVALQWPYQPSPAKLTYVESLAGFSKRKGSGAALRAFFVGEKEDPDGFVLPVAVAIGGDGRIAVADMGRKCVHLYLPAAARYLKLTGSKQETIASPVSLVFDEALRLYLSDSVGRLFVFGPGGEVLRVLHGAGEERFQRPTGLAYSPARKLLYVVDTLAHRVHALDAQGNLAFSFGRRGDEPGSFNFPTHISRSPSGELYVTDALNFRVQIFDETGKPLGLFGRHGDGSGDLAMPKGLAVDRDGVIYVADSLFDNVQLFNRQGEFLLTLGQRGIQLGEFWLPSGIFVSDSGELYVCDTYNRRIQVFRIAEGYAQAT